MEEEKTTTVAELVALIDRSKKALAEGGRPDLAERAHIIVESNGEFSMSFDRITRGRPGEVSHKALSLDPHFEPIS